MIRVTAGLQRDRWGELAFTCLTASGSSSFLFPQLINLIPVSRIFNWLIWTGMEWSNCTWDTVEWLVFSGSC